MLYLHRSGDQLLKRETVENTVAQSRVEAEVSVGVLTVVDNVLLEFKHSLTH